MKKLLLLFLLLFSPLTVKAENIPIQAPTNGVYDPNGYLTNETINRIKEINDKYAESDLKPQIGFVIVDEIDGNIEQVALMLKLKLKRMATLSISLRKLKSRRRTMFLQVLQVQD